MYKWLNKFKTIGEARSFIAQAEQRGYETHLSREIDGNGKPIYHVILRGHGI